MQPVSTCLDIVLCAASSVPRRTLFVPVFPPHSALNLVAAVDVFASTPYPPFISSIVDGYAFNCVDDFTKTKSAYIRISELTPAIYAGAVIATADTNTVDTTSTGNGPLHAIYAIYVTTGACIPSNYTCVVPIER